MTSTWICSECTQNNPSTVSECELCLHQRPRPTILLGAISVASVMILCSGLLTFALTETFNTNVKVQELLSIDAHSIENIGHAGLLVIFTGMYWLSGKLYCWYMISLSFYFMFLVSAMSSIISIVAAYKGAMNLIPCLVSTIFCSACVVGMFTLKYQVDDKMNFTLWSKRQHFPAKLLMNSLGQRAKSVRIANPSEDSVAVQKWNTRFRTGLLLRVAFMSLSIVIRGISATITTPSNEDFVVATWGQSFVQSFTMMFHQCFILSTGFAAMLRLDDTLEMYRHGSLVFGCYDVIQLLKYVRVKDANNYTMIVLECFLSALLHFGVFGICIVLRNATNLQSGNTKGSVQRIFRIPRPTIFALQSWRAKFVAVSATALALVWQGQCIFMVFNVSDEHENGADGNSVSFAASSSTSSSSSSWSVQERIQIFNEAINFGLHGAAFFLFHTVLSFQSKQAYKRLRELHILAGLFTGAYTLVIILYILLYRTCVLKSWLYRSVPECIHNEKDLINNPMNFQNGKYSNSNVYNLIYLYLIRMVICFSYGVAFLLYNEEELQKDQEMYQRQMHATHRYDVVNDEDDDEDDGEDNEGDGNIQGVDAEDGIEDGIEDGVEEEEKKYQVGDGNIQGVDAEDGVEEEEKKYQVAVAQEIEMIETNRKDDNNETMERTATTNCPSIILNDIYKYGRYGQYVTIGTGIFWSLYVILINMRTESLITSMIPSPIVLSQHRTGYGITFHVSYLLTLFAWDGFYSGNLITLDVGRNFSVSTLLVLVPMYVLIWKLNEWVLFGMMVLMAIGPIGVIVLSRIYVNVSQFWCIDPLTGWKR